MLDPRAPSAFRVSRAHRAIAIAGATLALALPLVAGCSNGASGGASATTTSTAPHKMTFAVVLLDDVPDPFAKPAEPIPKGISSFQEPVILGPQQIELRTFVRLVIQPGETLDQARARAKPWFDAIPLPKGDRLMFNRIEEENEVTKKREGVGVRTFVATSTVVLTQDDVAAAKLDAGPDQEGKPQPFALVQLTPDAGERFRVFTKQNALRRIAVAVDDDVIMTARIQDEIVGGQISIALDPETAFDVKKAQLQALVDGLNPPGASMPAPPTLSAHP